MMITGSVRISGDASGGTSVSGSQEGRSPHLGTVGATFQGPRWRLHSHYGSKAASRALCAREAAALGNVKYLDSLFGFLLGARLLVPGHSSKDKGHIKGLVTGSDN